MSSITYLLHPIGKVLKLPGKKPQLCIEKKYRQGFLHLEAFSHILVFWWADGCDNPKERSVLEVRPPIDRFPDAPRMGVFATKSPARPNPIMLSTVIIDEVDPVQGVIVVPYIDAKDGTPILDIKPYLPSSERVLDVQVPEWFASLDHAFRPPGPAR